MKRLMTILVVASFGGLASLARFGASPPVAVAAGSCDGGRTVAVTDATGLRSGSAIEAADGSAIAVVRDGGTARVTPPDHASGVIRHVWSRPGLGTAYVRDRAGGDLVVADTPVGVWRFSTRGEALQPSLSAAGDLVWAQGGGLRFAAAGSGTVRRIHGPVRGGLAFSPLFDAGGGITAGVAAPATRAVPEDEYRSNLWRYNPASHRWIQVTHFAGGTDRWSIVRTPVLAPDGALEFVRVHGRASLDRVPSFELWQLRGGMATMIRELPREMYLAGFDGSDRLWNLRDGTTGSWLIDREQNDGSLRTVACGSVAVDPLDRPDPDSRPGRRWAPLSPPRTASSSQHASTTNESSAPAVDAILVGDFASSGEADDAAARIRTSFGSPANVVTASQAPTVVRPGVWAVMVPLASGDAEADLARFREAFPDLAGWSWIVSI